MNASITQRLDVDARREGCMPPPPELPGRVLADLRLEDPDPDELIRHRFLSKRGGALLIAPTGVGKSSLIMQAAICWTAGAPCFGLEPSGPLKIWIIQAENDEGDLAEERDGICRGLTEDGSLMLEQVEMAQQELRIITEVSANGEDFGVWLARNLELARKQGVCPDLVVVDPVFSFLGGDSLSQRDVSKFLRNTLHPVLFDFHVACLLVHHTNKPSNLREKNATVYLGDLAYLGAGSAEWANWARAVLAIEKTAAPHIFRLHAAKRGKRLAWEHDGRPTFTRYIAHAREEGQIYWREATEEEIDSVPSYTPSGVTTVSLDEIVALVTNRPLPKSELQVKIQNRFGIGRDKARDHLRACVDSGHLQEESVSVNPHYKLVGLPGVTEKEARRQEKEYKEQRLDL